VGNAGEANAVVAGSPDRARHVGTMAYFIIGRVARSYQIGPSLDPRAAQIFVACLDAGIDDTDRQGASTSGPSPRCLCPDASVSPAVDEARIIGVAKRRQDAQGSRHGRCRKSQEPIANGPFSPEDARLLVEQSPGLLRRAAFCGTNPLPTGCDDLATEQRNVAARLDEHRLGAGTLRTHGQQGGRIRTLDTAGGGQGDARDEETTETGTNSHENLRAGSTHPACPGHLATTLPRRLASTKPQTKRARTVLGPGPPGNRS